VRSFSVALALVAAKLIPANLMLASLMLASLMLASLPPNAASAKGGTLHLFVPHSAASPFAQPFVPGVSTSNLLGGCGHGRYRDPATQKRRGPGDVRN
jgi:hypothetical protein